MTPSHPELGPSDSSDSPSDLAGQEASAGGDYALPADVALGPDGQRPAQSIEGSPEVGTDSAGTGERRSAAGDAGIDEAVDILPDRIVRGLPDDAEDGDPDGTEAAARAAP